MKISTSAGTIDPFKTDTRVQIFLGTNPTQVYFFCVTVQNEHKNLVLYFWFYLDR